MDEIKNEIKSFEELWQELLKLLDVVSTLEVQNEKLTTLNQEQFEEIKRLHEENTKLKKQLQRQEHKIQSLSDCERKLQLAKDKIIQANKISDEAKIQMKQIERLKSTLEDLIQDYYQRSLTLQEQERRNDGE